jgi:tRNA-Thr(GGU) m(6)t(6)A37 methyltransferase TsaA
MQDKQFFLKPLGAVKNQNGRCSVQLGEEYREALQEAEGFSHLQIFWWPHYLDSREMRAVRVVPKPYKKGPDSVGVFATRSPVRPNPIAVTTVSVLGMDIENGCVDIAFIDAEDGSPVLDIKPYYGMDRVRTLTVPDWCSHWPQWYEDSAEFDWEAEFENAR